ncbi:MAG: ATP-binding cassette domain-containing protein [Nitrososphaeria archaeon]|nr:ATP-binding cassette domain-containing protein [Nitrososphaeria archaeon]NIN52946.1 ATP-binding cassette domain-containing protein [Nitrososphaeria archaeon]NIQ33505.1 ATP-binding cassette domain-containing protein [Nitrososphaeria archaeon]
MSLLEVRDLRLYYDTTRGVVKAVDQVMFTVEGGEALGIVGESGCGKTSLALAIIRLLPSNVHTYKGLMALEGVDLMKLSDDEFRKRIRWRKISMVFQGAMSSLNPVMRVGHQVVEPMLLDGSTGKEEARREATSLLEMVGISGEVFNRYPHELSGGMKQRVIIAMSLILKPKLVIMDEPTSALDVSVQAQITNLLKRLKRDLGLSMVFITHDIALASDISDRLAVMYGGEMVELGSSEQVLTSPSHPYTEKLLASTPMLRGDVRPTFIPGAPPDLINPPSGCHFHPRCPHAFELCRHETPEFFQTGKGHVTRCWLHRGCG